MKRLVSQDQSNLLVGEQLTLVREQVAELDLARLANRLLERAGRLRATASEDAGIVVAYLGAVRRARHAQVVATLGGIDERG